MATRKAKASIVGGCSKEQAKSRHRWRTQIIMACLSGAQRHVHGSMKYRARHMAVIVGIASAGRRVTSKSATAYQRHERKKQQSRKRKIIKRTQLAWHRSS